MRAASALSRALTPHKLVLMAALAVSVQTFVVFGVQCGISTEISLVMCALLVAATMAGTRLMYVLSHAGHFRAHPREIIEYGRAGASSFGGVTAGIATTIPVAMAFAVPLGPALDTLALAGLPGLAIGRIGCLFNGCCPGRRRPETGECHTERRIPYHLFEVGLVFSAWSCLLVIHTNRPEGGTLFLVGAASYGVIRLGTDALRELPRRRWGLADSQLVAAALAAIGVSGLLAMP